MLYLYVVYCLALQRIRQSELADYIVRLPLPVFYSLILEYSQIKFNIVLSLFHLKRSLEVYKYI